MLIVRLSLPPTKSTNDDGLSVLNPAHVTWIRQYKLLFGALAGTLSPTLSPLIFRARTSKEAWDSLTNTYAKPSRGHIKNLKSQLKHITKGPSYVDDYISKFRRIIDELALLGVPLDPENVTDHPNLLMEGQQLQLEKEHPQETTPKSFSEETF